MKEDNATNRRRLPRYCSGTWLLLLILSALADVAPARPPEQRAGTGRIASLIDRRVADTWKRNGVKPAAFVDDGVYLRRVSLDLVGRVPTVAEARTFLDETHSAKRTKLVVRLLNSPEFARHWATVLRRIWVPQTDTQEFARLIGGYERWLSRRLRERTLFDELVRQQLNAPISRMAVPNDPDGRGLGSSAFLAVSELKPENLAANTARAFLGINIDCAQCHNHPFARWTREQFWQTAAFFARPKTETKNAVLSIAVGDTKATVAPRLLTGGRMDWPRRVTVGTGHQLLAKWITSRDNPYFARNAVNRIWANFFGIGFIEPLDDLSGAVPSSHPKLFAELAKEFTDSGFDLRHLIRGLVLSRPYQLASVSSKGSSPSDEPQLISRMPVRALTGEQLYDSLRTAAGMPHSARKDGSTYRRSSREEFAARFLVPRSIDGQRSLVQALTMMNGTLTVEVAGTKSPVIVAVADAPFLSDRERIETLFLAAYSRKPLLAESRPLLAHLKAGKDRRAALSDVFWALLNSSEFNTNH